MKTCLPERFDSDFDLTHKTTDCRIGTSAGYVCSRWIRVLFRNAFKTASGFATLSSGVRKIKINMMPPKQNKFDREQF